VVKGAVARLGAAGVVLLAALGVAAPAGAIELDPVIELPPPPPPEPEPSTTLPPPPPPEPTTTVPPPPPPEPEPTTTLPPPEPTTTVPPPPPPDPTTTEPPPPPPPDPTTTVPPPPPPPDPTTTLPPVTDPPTTGTPSTPTTDPPDPTTTPPSGPPTTPVPIVRVVDPVDVPVITFPPKTVDTTTTSDDPGSSSSSSGSSSSSSASSASSTSGARRSGDPSTTDAPDGTVALPPKVAVKTIPSAGRPAVDGEAGSSEVGGEGTGAGDTRTTRLISAPAPAEPSEGGATPVAARTAGSSRSIPEPLRSPLGGVLVAALVAFVAGGSYCGWLLLGGRR
jgi:hypothetical protein